jgi:acetate kinase
MVNGSCLLLLNAGSSSLKCHLMSLPKGEPLALGAFDWAGATHRYRCLLAGVSREQSFSGRGHAEAVQVFLKDLRDSQLLGPSASYRLAGVGHRVVHGGDFSRAMLVTDEVEQRIDELSSLAPLHHPPCLQTLHAARAALPSLPQVAVFDTAFHATMPASASTYPIPETWTEQWGIRRYGFHGLSHAYCSQRAAVLLQRKVEELRLIICHLGHGCSASAVVGGKSLDTTMGFTPLDGLMMATRSGAIDPGIIFFLQREYRWTAAEIEEYLQRRSGLLGVSALSADMREVLAAAAQGHARSQLAVSMYVHRVKQVIGAYTASMGGVDGLVFTAGVGENSAEIRRRVCQGLEFLGLHLDGAANDDCHPDQTVSHPGSPAQILVIKTREELSMLREVASVLQLPVDSLGEPVG